MADRFKDYNSPEHYKSLCHLYSNNGQGVGLGSVWLKCSERGRPMHWVWETSSDITGEEIEGTAPTRRKAKAALRAALKPC